MIELSLLAIFLVFVRVSAFIAFLPLFQGKQVPQLVKVGLALGLTLHWSVQVVPNITLGLLSFGASQWLIWGGLIIREAVLGAATGWLLGLVFTPIRMAGAFIAQEMGLTMATLTSSADGSNSNVVTEILDALVILTFLAMNGHHLFYYTIHSSLRTFPVAERWSLPTPNWFLNTITETIPTGVHLATPIAALLFTTSVSLLFIMRQTPQFNLFNFGMPVRLVIGFVLLIIFIPELIFNSSRIIQHWISVL